MSQLGEVPAMCPRRIVGGDGPRQCAFIECPQHLRHPATRGASAHRVRLVVLEDDTCTRDVCARAKKFGVTLSQRHVARLLGITRQAVQQLEKRALVKLRSRKNRLR